MPRNIDYYFYCIRRGPISAMVPFMEIVRRHDAKVTYKPISLADVFAETGGLPVAKRHPARLRYRILELQRWREKRGLKFNLHPKFWPFNARSPTVRDCGGCRGDDPDPFLRRAFAAIWEGEQNLADDATLIALADGVKLPCEELLACRQARREQGEVRAERQGTPSRSKSSVHQAMSSTARSFGAKIGLIF